jgi:Leucine-rich repeat (LRR) protein
MGLTEVPSELFRMKNLKRLTLANNELCSLPSKLAHLTTLELFYVRLSKRSDRDLTQKPCCFRSARTSLSLFRPSSVC